MSSRWPTDTMRLWWVLDPRQVHHCKDCQRIAGQSPYGPPGSGLNELNQTPGDGRTECGAACTCDLSYTPPHTVQWPAVETISPSERAMLTFNWRQRAYVLMAGVTPGIRIHWWQIKFVVFPNGAIVSATDTQFFESSQDGTVVMLWQRPPTPPKEDMPKRTQKPKPPKPDPHYERIGYWHITQFLWVFPKGFLEAYEASGKTMPEWSDEHDDDYAGRSDLTF